MAQTPHPHPHPALPPRRARRLRHRRGVVVLQALLLTAALALTGCTSSGYPADPEGTFDRITDGTLRVGVSHHPPHVDVTGAEPAGTEVELIEAFAEEHDAQIEWTASTEEALMTALQDGVMDLVAGGLTSQSPWSSHAALTRSYTEATGADGSSVHLVMAVPMGENQMLSELERFLDEQPEQALQPNEQVEP